MLETITGRYKNIGFAGAGNMGEAIIGALINSCIFSPLNIFINDINKERLDFMNKTYGVSILADNFKLFSQCDIIILAVKPQQMTQLLTEITGNPDYGIYNRKLVISIAAGITIKKIEDILYKPLDDKSRKKLPIIRVMPNTPALVLAGISGMSLNNNTSYEDADAGKTILNSMGKVIEVKEELLNAVTAVSGSGPAYVFYLVEAMIKGGIEAGLEPGHAAEFSIATLDGAVKLMMAKNESPEELRRKVTSPGGTTEAAIRVLDNNDVKHHIIEAIAAAAKRGEELSS
ncbi:Pyrroline-5-carboxylate reductase [Desulfonema limicola]|uniref:Pyrroline-5-carboxylate reductase n=1 Tax=Desulfonema limicola TaxID=45656 RepID=A0A975GFA6_9BACT|nr:pyrroline-5-carboxylate reductase [Desulfonema limicola]QTA79062.1 Pyrroline-5-carboxylate reductase [Desulfonema limicola]